MKVLIQFENKPLLFQDPESVISCSDPSKFSACFREIERALERGYYLAGFFSYEAGYCFEERLRGEKPCDFPLVLLGAYKEPDKEFKAKYSSQEFSVSDFCLNISREKYGSHIEIIRDYIAEGDVYQITYCIKFHFNFKGDSFALYQKLLKEQPVPYPAYIQSDDFTILSLSPERFIKKNAGQVVTEPMKGTWPREEGLFSDLTARYRLWSDIKNRAENVMIADLLRNDLGRVGMHIRAPKLFTVAGYNTLFQMTSTVTGIVSKDIPIYNLFAAIFPSGSVTGAPKIRAMQIIRELESQERKIYTGAIGYIAPNRDLYFNIPIRTLLIQGESGEMGVGGGIVWDSTAQGEWDEGLLKAKFLTDILVENRKEGV